MFGQADFVDVPRPHLFGLDATSDRAYYYVALVVAALCAAVVIGIRRSRLGRAAARHVGLARWPSRRTAPTPRLTRLYVFGVAAGLAAVGGVLIAGVTQSAGGTADGPFGYFNSVVLLAVLAFCGSQPILSPVIAAFLFEVVKVYQPFNAAWFTNYEGVFFGLGRASWSRSHRACALRLPGAATTARDGRSPVASRATLALLQPLRSRARRCARDRGAARPRGRRPDGELRWVVGRRRRVAPCQGGRRHRAHRAQRSGQDHDLQRVHRGACRPRRARSARAARSRSPFDPGRASHGLGRDVPTHGALRLHDRGRERGARARGLPRRPAPLESAGVLPARAPRHRDAQQRSACDRCGIAPMARQRVGDLSTGQRRLVELARAIATPFRFLLLDEPSSGLDVRETELFGQIIGRFVADTGIGILLVEHDMALVSGVCDYIYVLDFGILIFQGPCAEVMSSETVRAAYLGSDAISVDDAAEEAGDPCLSSGMSAPATARAASSRTWTSSCPTARSSRCWGPTAPARRRCSR